jgi:hypothetical protein
VQCTPGFALQAVLEAAWVGLGGHIEDGEKPVTAAAREVGRAIRRKPVIR